VKVALVLTGYMRNWKLHYPIIKENIIDKYNPDVYITSYSYSQEHWRSGHIPVDVDEVKKYYKPKNYIFRDQETCPPFYFKLLGRESISREWSERQLRGWYTNYLSTRLFDFNDYNTIIKSRTDLGVKNLTIDSTKKLVIPAWKVHPACCEPDESYIDYFAYGNSKYMKKYFLLYQYMQAMHIKNLADISLGETLIYDYIENYIGQENVTLDYEIDWLLREAVMWATEHRDYYLTLDPDGSKKLSLPQSSFHCDG
jgi:hypothetical protein